MNYGFILLVGLVACSTSRQSEPHPVNDLAQVLVQPIEAVVPGVKLPTSEELRGRLTFAEFKNERLWSCSDIAVATRADPRILDEIGGTKDRDAGQIAPETVVAALKQVGKREMDGVAFAIYDDITVSQRGGKGIAKDNSDNLGAATVAFALFAGMAKLPPGTPGRPSTKDFESSQKMFAQLVWPPKSLAAQVKSGAIIRVDSCETLNKSPLASCQLGSRSDLCSWSVTQNFYSATVLDDDAAMRRCLLIRGKWDASEVDASHQRVREHAKDLQDQIKRLNRAVDRANE